VELFFFGEGRGKHGGTFCCGAEKAVKFSLESSWVQATFIVERMKMQGTMTIRIPDDLAHGLERIAAAQRKSVEELALESLRSICAQTWFDKTCSPEHLLRAIREASRPSEAAVDDLEAAIAAGRLPVRDGSAFR
jgi:predicted transcriptional regulator